MAVYATDISVVVFPGARQHYCPNGYLDWIVCRVAERHAVARQTIGACQCRPLRRYARIAVRTTCFRNGMAIRADQTCGRQFRSDMVNTMRPGSAVALHAERVTGCASSVRYQSQSA